MSKVFSEAELTSIFQESLRGFYRAYVEADAILQLPPPLVKQWKELLLKGHIKDGRKHFDTCLEQWSRETMEGRKYFNAYQDLRMSNAETQVGPPPQQVVHELPPSPPFRKAKE